MEMTKDNSPASSPHRVTIPFNLYATDTLPAGLCGPEYFASQLGRRCGPTVVAAWTHAHETLKEGLQGFYGDNCGFLFVLSVVGLPWFCLAQTKRDTFLRQWLADLNSLLEPHGFHAKFQRLLARDENQRDELWLAIATTAEDADSLRREPIFWRRGHCGPGRYPSCCSCCCCQLRVV